MTWCRNQAIRIVMEALTYRGGITMIAAPARAYRPATPGTAVAAASWPSRAVASGRPGAVTIAHEGTRFEKFFRRLPSRASWPNGMPTGPSGIFTQPTRCSRRLPRSILPPAPRPGRRRRQQWAEARLAAMRQQRADREDEVRNAIAMDAEHDAWSAGRRKIAAGPPIAPLASTRKVSISPSLRWQAAIAKRFRCQRSFVPLYVIHR